MKHNKSLTANIFIKFLKGLGSFPANCLSDYRKSLSHVTIAGIFLLAISSCDPELKKFQPESGNADFSVYIAVGSSKTAGFANNELYRFGQAVSYPNILSRQMIHAGGGEFRQPLMRDEAGFGNRLVLAYSADCNGDSIITPVPEGSMPDDENSLNIFDTEGPFHNFGVPRARISQLVQPISATGNPFQSYFARFASSSSASVLSDAMETQATFFSLWIGKNDILEFALTGGTGFVMPDHRQFDSIFTQILTGLKSVATFGIVANIPDITSFPILNHITNTGLWVADSLAPEGKRVIKEGEMVLLRAQEAILCDGLGREDNPITENLFLSSDQVEQIRAATQQYNEIIAYRTAETGLPLVDLHQIYEVMREGITFDGISFSNRFITGGFFSIDGMTLSRRGNAIVANTFIEAINDHYRSTIPKVSVTQYQGIEYP